MYLEMILDGSIIRLKVRGVIICSVKEIEAVSLSDIEGGDVELHEDEYWRKLRIKSENEEIEFHLVSQDTEVLKRLG
jgi:hypothetical protein